MTSPDPRMPDMPADAERSRGRYVHVREGGPAGMDERWVAGEVGPGAVRIRSTRVAASPTSRLEVDVRLAGPTSSAVLRWTGSGDGVVRSATAECVVVEGRVQVRRTVDGVVHEPLLVDRPLLLPALVLAGRLRPGGAAALVVGDARDAASFLLPVDVEIDVQDAGRVAVEGVDGVLRRWRAYAAQPGAPREHGGQGAHGSQGEQGGRGEMPGDGGRAAEVLGGEDVVSDAGLLLRRTAGGVTATLAELSGPPLTPSAWAGDGLLLR